MPKRSAHWESKGWQTEINRRWEGRKLKRPTNAAQQPGACRWVQPQEGMKLMIAGVFIGQEEQGLSGHSRKEWYELLLSQQSNRSRILLQLSVVKWLVFQTKKVGHRVLPFLRPPKLTSHHHCCSVMEHIICKPEKYHCRIVTSHCAWPPVGAHGRRHSLNLYHSEGSLTWWQNRPHPQAAPSC